MPSLRQLAVRDIVPPLFSLRFGRKDAELAQSIEQVGLIQPLIVWERDGAHHLLNGTARMACLRRAVAATAAQAGLRQGGPFTIPCLVFGQSEITRERAFILALEANRWERGFNLVEKAMALRAARDVFGSGAPWDAVIKILGLKNGERLLTCYEDLLALPGDVLKLVIRHDLSLTLALRFWRFPVAEISEMARSLLNLHLNQNRVLEILELLYDIGKRENLSPGTVLRQALTEVPRGQNPGTREQALRDRLRQRRHPLYERARADFAARVKRLSPPRGVTVSPTAFFEDDSVEIRAKLSSHEERRQLVRMLNDDIWEQLICEENARKR